LSRVAVAQCCANRHKLRFKLKTVRKLAKHKEYKICNLVGNSAQQRRIFKQTTEKKFLIDPWWPLLSEMMLEEEAGYNPFVEQQQAGEGSGGKELLDKSSGGHSFLEGDHGKRFSFIENSPNLSARQSPSSSPSLRVIVPFEESTETQPLQNPFVNDTISLDDTEESPSLPSLPSGSPLKSPTDRITHSPSQLRPPGSPRLPSSPLATSSSNLASPRSESPSLFTYKSPPTPRALVTLEKQEWVPDEYPILNEYF
jgi:hypothetical protein